MWVKICGLCDEASARACFAAGASAIGINLWPESKRYCPPDKALVLAQAVAHLGEVVFVTVNADNDLLSRVSQVVPTAWLQFHGDEPADRIAAHLPRAYAARPLGTAADLDALSGVPGNRLLVDAPAGHARGGTGKHAAWPLAANLSATRRLILAGGLTPETVASAITNVRPYGVDVASGIESAPATQDMQRVTRFIAQARRARPPGERGRN